MGGKHRQERIAQQQAAALAAKQAQWAAMAASCPPGIHLLTCSYCGYTGKFPIAQQVVSHVTIGMINAGRPQHPGEYKL